MAMLSDSASAGRSIRLSYKFQRLRERIRAAIDTGELAGKLPGERLLAKRFRVNAKTLSKALTDLAAEGVLERNIGLGTFVRGKASCVTGPVGSKADRLLVLADDSSQASALLGSLGADFESVQLVTDPAALRPSLLQGHKRALLLSTSLPEPQLRDLIVRGMSVVRVGGNRACYSTHHVLIDEQLAVAQCVRRLATMGRKNLLVIDEVDGPLHTAARLAAGDLPAGEALAVRAGSSDDVVTGAADALVCRAADASSVMTRARRLGLSVPDDVTILAVGELTGDAPAPGFYVTTARVRDAVCKLFADTASHKPITLFLNPEAAGM